MATISQTTFSNFYLNNADMPLISKSDIHLQGQQEPDYQFDVGNIILNDRLAPYLP